MTDDEAIDAILTEAPCSGLDGRGGRTLADVAAQVGLSRQRTYQIEALALERLRGWLAD